MERPHPVFVDSKLFQKLLAGLLVLFILKSICPQLLRIDLQEFDAVGPIHVPRVRHVLHDFAIVRALHSPIDFAQNPDIRGLQGFNFLRNLLQGDGSCLFAAFLCFLAFCLHLGHEAVLIGEEQEHVVEFDSTLNVPAGDAEGWAETLDFEGSRASSSVIGFIVDEGSGGHGVKLFRQCWSERLVEA